MNKRRIKEAVEALKEGIFLPIENLNVTLEENNTILVIGSSSYSYIENITKPVAKKELENIKLQFIEMRQEVRELKDFVQGKSIKYVLAFFIPKSQGTFICSEQEGTFEWLTKLKE